MIDLHTHTDESDGTYTPAELVAAAVSQKLEALGITDHDTLAGYDAAEPLAREAGLDLVCGIELSTKLRGRSVHLLGYFLDAPPKQAFRDWLHEMQMSRRDRNIRLAAKLRSMGFDISLEEVEARGKSLAGRPHFAQVMVEKGYVENTRQASTITWTNPPRLTWIARNRSSGRPCAASWMAGVYPPCRIPSACPKTARPSKT